MTHATRLKIKRAKAERKMAIADDLAIVMLIMQVITLVILVVVGR